MAYTSITKRTLALGAALLLVLTLIGATTLASHHQHDHDHDETLCTVCQLIQASIATLRSISAIPMSAWGIFMPALPLVFMGLGTLIPLAYPTLVAQKIRCNN